MRPICRVQHVFICALAACCLACHGQTNSGANAAGQWIVAAPAAWRAALAPLIEHRRANGFEVVVIDTTELLNGKQLGQQDGTALQSRLDPLLQRHKGPNYVLLAGAFRATDPTNAQFVVPALRGSVGRMKGEPSDCGYGQPGPDGAPVVAVGRLPARSEAELSAMVQKTLAFERSPTPASSRNRLVLLVGSPGGGPLADSYVGQQLDSSLAALHASWDVRTLFNVASSRFYLPRPEDRETALRYLAGGELFSVYLGHSNAEGLGLDAHFMPRHDWAVLGVPGGAGPFFTCGCFACQSGQNGDGYGLAAMRNPSGPAAVIGATGESYSFAGQLAVEGLLACLKEPPFPPRLADYWLAIQAGLARGKMNDMVFSLLDMADGSGGKTPIAVQRLEHLQMWMLLGDPALRLPVVPVDVALHVDGPLAAGRELKVSGDLPQRLDGAKVRLTLERPAGSIPSGLEKVPENSPENRDARKRVFLANHERANSFVLATADAQVSAIHFTGILEVPSDLPWSNLVLRATATAPQDEGFGILRLPK